MTQANLDVQHDNLAPSRPGPRGHNGAADVKVESVLSRAAKADIVTDPYPHIVVENALSEPLYERLAAEFPPLNFFLPNEHHVSNAKYIAKGTNCLESDVITPLWKDFIAYHMSAHYYEEVVALFGEYLRQYHGEVEEALGRKFAEMSTGHRTEALHVPNMQHPYDVMLDCQPQLDYSFTSRPFRGPHVDSGSELYAGLLYMRAPEDESEGGSIAVWRAKEESEVFPRERTIKTDERAGVVRREKLELVRDCPYRPNTLVMFINSWRSLHCAQTRSPSLLPRRAVNIIGEVCRFPRPQLFDVDRPAHLQKKPPQASLIRRVAKRLLRP